MRADELIRLLATFPAETPVTFVRDDFPRNVEGAELETVSVYGDHWHVEYYPEVSEETLQTIVVLRES